MTDGAHALVRAVRKALAQHFTSWAVQPHIVAWESRPWASATFSGTRACFTVMLVTARGTSHEAVIQAHDQVIRLLHDADLAIAGHVLIDLQFCHSRTPDPDPDGSAVCQLDFEALVIVDQPSPLSHDARIGS